MNKDEQKRQPKKPRHTPQRDGEQHDERERQDIERQDMERGVDDGLDHRRDDDEYSHGGDKEDVGRSDRSPARR